MKRLHIRSHVREEEKDHCGYGEDEGKALLAPVKR